MNDVASPQPTESPRTWYSGATHGQWLALLAALLGWAFDGFEMGVFPVVARPALIELEGLTEQEAIRKATSSDALRAVGGPAVVAVNDEVAPLVDEPVRAWNGVATVAFLVGASLGGLLFGWIGDRIGRVRAMVFSVLTYAVFTGLCGFSQQAWHIIALRFIAALGMGGEWSLGVALVMEKWPGHARPVLAGLIGAASNLGFLIIGPLSLVLKPTESWRLILVFCVLPALLTFFIRMFVPESEKWQKAVSSGPKPGIVDIFVRGLRGRALLGAALGAVALLATWGGVQWIPLWLGKENSNLVPYAQMASAGGATVGAFLGAYLGARVTRRLGYLSLCVLSLLICEVLFFGLHDGPFGGLFLVVVFLVGAFSASFYGWLPLYLPELFPTRVRAAGQGFCYNAGRALAAIGVLFMVFVLDFRGDYARAASFVVLIYFVGMALVWFAPETKGQPLPE